MADLTAVTRGVRAIASYGVSSMAAGGIVVDGTTWPALLSRIDHERLTGIAVDALEGGRLVLTEAQAEELMEHHAAAMHLVLEIEQQLLYLLDVFTVAGIRTIVLKGSAAAHTLYPDPAMRPFGDLDLLVSTEDWQQACHVLGSEGYTRHLPEPRPGFDERFGKAATHTGPSGLPVDLHRTIVLGPFGLWLDPDELLRYTATFRLAGRAVERLDATGMLINAALHAALGTAVPLLLPLRDVAQSIGRTDIDRDRLEDWARRWRLGVALRRAFALTASEMNVAIPEPAARAGAVPSRRSESRALRAYTDGRGPGAVAFAATRAIHGVRGKTAYLSGLLLPSRAFLAARAPDASRVSYLSRWMVPLRSSIGRRRRGMQAPFTVEEHR